MNWLQKIAREEPRIADPHEMGYEDEWGEHHGPVEYIPDTWNYGPKGYYSPPIPMPKKLYHASPYADAIIEQGFILPKDLGKQTFGGSDDFMSFTHLNNAIKYKDVIQDLVRVANGQVDHLKPRDAVQYFGDKWNVDPESLESFYKGMVGDRQESPRKAVIYFFGYIHNYGADVPFIFGNSGVLDNFQGMDPDDVGVVEVETQPLQWNKGTNIGHETDMSQNYTYNRHENEWRVYDPSGIRPIRRIV